VHKQHLTSTFARSQAEELLRRNGEYQAMVTDLQRRLNDARSAADEAADKSRRESQRCQVSCGTLVQNVPLLQAGITRFI
jgi:hypothetical protein